MKMLKRMLYTALCLCLLLTTALPVSAREEEYTYTVRFFAGKQGTFQSGEMMAFEGLHYGDRINFYYNAVTLNDNSKYYIRGIRESGKDNSDSFQTSSFVVTGDMDYVIAYGILGDATSYTIHYVDGDGNSLAPSETYYGNVGDRPVVAYIYIEGWMPQAYNMTQTLQSDPAENVFTFVYTRLEQPTPPAPGPAPAPAPAPAPEEPAPEPEPEPTVPVPANPGIVVIPNDETPLGPGPGGAGADGPDAPGPDDGGDNPGGEDGAGGEDIPDDDTPTGTPDELQNLDDDVTPTTNFLFPGADARLLGIPVPVMIVVGMAAVGAVAAAWYFLIFRKKKKEDKGKE